MLQHTSQFTELMVVNTVRSLDHLHKQGEVLHQAVDDIIQTRQEGIRDQASLYTTANDKLEDVINAAIEEIKHTIQELKNLLEIDDVSLVSWYKCHPSIYCGSVTVNVLYLACTIFGGF